MTTRLLIAYGLILLVTLFVAAWAFLAVRRQRRKEQKLYGYRR
jgi:preprotein translocase subunit YajC